MWADVQRTQCMQSCAPKRCFSQQCLVTSSYVLLQRLPTSRRLWLRGQTAVGWCGWGCYWGAPGWFLRNQLMRKLLALEQEAVTKETAEEKEPPRIFPETDLAEAFADLRKCCRKFENTDQHWRVFLNRGMFMVHYLLTSKSMMTKRNRPSEPPWTHFLRSDTSSRRASGSFLRRSSRGRLCYHRWQLPVCYCLNTSHWDRRWRWRQGCWWSWLRAGLG